MHIYKKLLVSSLCFFCSGIVNAGYIESKEAFMKHDYKLAHDQCIHSANVGNSDCQNALGYLYQHGLGVRKDSDQAFRWFMQAANKKNTNAQYNLGLMYSSGEGTEFDLQKSSKWILKAAEGNHIKAQLNIGTIYAEGRGVEVNLSKAFYWWQKAAEQGNPMAQNNLGWALTHGKGVAVNHELAESWLRKAIDQNSDDDARVLAGKNIKLISKSTASSSKKELKVKVDISKPDVDGKVILSVKTIDSSPLKVMRISGKDLGSNTSGVFKVVRYVPVGESHIDVYAEDQFGEKFMQQYTVNREGVAKNTPLPELDPTKINPSVRRDAVAIVIGAEQYEFLPRADFADNDARSFYDYANRALGVPREKIKLLSGFSAKRSDILLAIRNWLGAEIVSGKTEVFIFYSGHGLSSPDGKKRYFLPVDANIDLLEDTAIAHDQLLKIVNFHNPKAITMMVDSCYSGTSRSGGALLASVRPVAIHSEVDNLPTNTTLISSSSGSQISASSVEIGHGLFSYFVMKGLEGEADSNKDQKITAQELHAYVAERVGKEAFRRGIQQNPAISGVTQKVLALQK